MIFIPKLALGFLWLFTILVALPTPVLANNLADIINEGDRVEQVVTGFAFTEGPVWHDGGFLLFSDIPANTIYQLWTGDRVRLGFVPQPNLSNNFFVAQPDQQVELKVFRHPSGNANGNTLNRQGSLLSAEYANRRISLTQKDGTMITLTDRYQGKYLNSPNDLVVKSDGSIYFTDPNYSPKFIQHYHLQKHSQELEFYGVYRLTPDGKLTLLCREFLHPNGIAFSPDETKLYISDFQKSHIRVFDVKPDGTLTNGHIFAQLNPSSQIGGPDGIKVDRRGNVYCTGPEGVSIFSPAGDFMGLIQVPEVPSNLAFGDSDYQTLYITAKTSIYRIHPKIPGSAVTGTIPYL